MLLVQLGLFILASLFLMRGKALAHGAPDAKPTEKRVDVPGGRVLTLTFNPSAGGAALLVVHGGPGASHGYLADLAALAGDRPVVFYDQLDCGESDHPGDPANWTLARSLAELAAVRQGLGLGRFHLLGQSWGGAVCAAYAQEVRDPGLASLILSAPLLSAKQWISDQKTWLAKMPEEFRRAVREAESSGRYEDEAYQRAMDAFYREHLCRMDPWPECVERAFSGMNVAMYGRMWGPSEFTVSGSLKELDLSDRLSEIAVPTLFTCGEYDEAAPASMRRFAARIPGATVAVFPGASHMHHLERPELFVQTVMEFLAQVEKGGA